MHKISIIIPVYNTKEYLEKCIESVRAQTYQNIEIICVDDGSTDGSGALLDALAEKDARMKVIHKQNGGLVSARKAGINAATGEYAGYVDSDDWIEPDMYENLYRVVCSTNADVITCGYFLEGNYTTVHLDNVEEGLYREQKMRYLRDNTIYRLESRETGLRGGLWCKLFRTELLKRIQNSVPDMISIAEDKMCLLKFILESTSVYVLKKPLYHWVIRKNSMSHESRNSYLLKIQYVYDYLTELYKHVNFTAAMRLQAEIYITELLMLGINKRMGFQNRNMIWIDPYWLDKIPLNSKVILYGAGELGEKYFRQLRKRTDLHFICCVDPKYEVLASEEFLVQSPQVIVQKEYDYIVITVKNKEKALGIQNELVKQGIHRDKMIWCEQPEVYWKYLEAEGLAPGTGGND